MLSPQTLNLLQISYEHHESLQEVGVHHFGFPLHRGKNLHKLGLVIILLLIPDTKKSRLFGKSLLVAVQKGC
jgi:hypothetical protein